MPIIGLPGPGRGAPQRPSTARVVNSAAAPALQPQHSGGYGDAHSWNQGNGPGYGDGQGNGHGYGDSRSTSIWTPPSSEQQQARPQTPAPPPFSPGHHSSVPQGDPPAIQPHSIPAGPQPSATPSPATSLPVNIPGDAHSPHSSGASGTPNPSTASGSGATSGCDGLCSHSIQTSTSTVTPVLAQATPTPPVIVPATPSTPVSSTPSPSTTPSPALTTIPTISLSGFPSTSSLVPLTLGGSGGALGRGLSSLVAALGGTGGLTVGGGTATPAGGGGGLAFGLGTLAPATGALGLPVAAATTTGTTGAAGAHAGAGHHHHSSSGGGTTILFIPRFINHIPEGVWIALGASLLLAAVGAGAAFASRRRAAAQAGELAAVSAAALTDPLTGVLNRRGFIEAVERELARARRYHHPFVLAYVDVRGLKAINDSEGHLAGDTLLKNVAALLTECARADDVVGRLGGDELGLLLVEQTPEAAKAVTRRIATQVAARREAMGFGAHWDLTVGSAAFPQDGQTVDELLATADRRLYQQRGIQLVGSR